MEDMIKTIVRQTRGPKLVFTGREIARVEFTTQGRDPLFWQLGIWETAGGAYIAFSSSLPENRQGIEDVRCSVVEPGGYEGDPQSMQFAVMDHFDCSWFA